MDRMLRPLASMISPPLSLCCVFFSVFELYYFAELQVRRMRHRPFRLVDFIARGIHSRDCCAEHFMQLAQRASLECHAERADIHMQGAAATLHDVTKILLHRQHVFSFAHGALTP